MSVYPVPIAMTQARIQPVADRTEKLASRHPR
jgi:hypothetical protein